MALPSEVDSTNPCDWSSSNTGAMFGEGDSGCATDTTLGRSARDNRDFALKKHEGSL